jgi:hypothetical protein
MVSLNDRSQLIDWMFNAIVQTRRTELSQFVYDATGGIVASGPFAGMKILSQTSWRDGDLLPKLLGTYEQELHVAVSYFASKTYDAVVNVGCAEGYYAVGLSRLFPQAPIFAFDINDDARKVCGTAAEANGRTNLHVGRACYSESLKELSQHYKKMLCVVDCEGFELELLPQGLIAEHLKNSDLIIECHDCVKAGITDQLIRRFAETHDVVDVKAGGRNPNSFPFLQHLGDLDRWIMMWEGRPCVMNWLLCEAKDRLTPNIAPVAG